MHAGLRSHAMLRVNSAIYGREQGSLVRVTGLVVARAAAMKRRGWVRPRCSAGFLLGPGLPLRRHGRLRQSRNGLLTRTPAYAWSALRFSEYRVGQPSSCALRRIIASQNDAPVRR